MTGYAAREGQGDGAAWSWELRGVNARGLDIRLRLPDGLGGLEAPLRKRLGAAVSRGSVTLGLRLARDSDTQGSGLDETALARVLSDLARVQAAAAAEGLTVAPPTAAEIYVLKGVLDGGETAATPSLETLLADLDPLLAAFVDMRRGEGASLEAILRSQLARIDDLVARAHSAADARSETQAVRFRASVAALLEAGEGLDPARIAQEVAMLAVKSDVTEEIDRLRAHIGAARDLLDKGGAVGRKLDFLMQEFNREANTLCSKSGDTALTAIGLDLKHTIDQMREQVQNLE